MREHHFDLHSVPLTAETVASYDVRAARHQPRRVRLRADAETRPADRRYPRRVPGARAERGKGVSVHAFLQPITDRNIRFALVGCGRIAKNHFESMKKHGEEAELVAVCDINDAALEAAQSATRGRGLLALRGPAREVRCRRGRARHAERPASRAGDPDGREGRRHVMTEKPMATRWQDGKRMVAACDAAGVRLFVVKQNRRNATLQLLKRAVEKKRFGRIYMVNDQRVLDPAAGVLRQRQVARHLGVRRRRVHEPGEPLRRPARLADRPGRKRAGLHRDAGAQHRGRGHRRRRRCAGARARSAR